MSSLAAAATGFAVLFSLPVVLHLGFHWAEASTGSAPAFDFESLVLSNALWALAWTGLGILPLAYGLRRRSPRAAKSWAPVLGLAGLAFVVACLRLAPSSSGTADLLLWAFAEAVLVVLGFLAFQAVAP